MSDQLRDLEERIHIAQADLSAARGEVDAEFARCAIGHDCEGLAGARVHAANLAARLDELLHARELALHELSASEAA